MHDFTLLKKQLSPDEAWFERLAVHLDSDFQAFSNLCACAMSKRVVVEHSISGLKRYSILSGRLLMHNLEQFAMALEVWAELWNLYLTH